MVWVQEADRRSDDAVPVSVGIVAESDVKPVLKLYQAGHRKGARTIHTDLAVMIHRHKRKRRVDIRIHDRYLETIPLGQRLPISYGGSAKRINADLHASGADGFQTDDLGEILHVGHDEVLRVGCGGLERGFKLDAPNTPVSVAQQFVGAILNRVRDIRVGWTAICQVIFEAAVSRRIVRRSDDNAIGKALRATLVVRKDGVRNDRRRREAVVALNESLHAVRSEHLERNAFRGTG